MFDGDWRGKFVSAVVLATGAFCIVAILYGIVLEHWSKQNEVYDRHQEHAERQRQATRNEIAELCSVRSGNAFLSCLDQKIEAHDRASEASEDLQAQQEMALWGLWILVATTASVFVTVVGIHFVRKTLAANTAAVEQAREANRIARSEQRPWISLDIDVTDIVVFRSERASLRGDIIVKNIGKSPTKCVEILEVYSFKDVQTMHKKVLDTARSADPIFNILPNQEARRPLIGWGSDMDLIYVTSAASYVSDGIRFMTSSTWRIYCKDANGNPMRFDERERHDKASIHVAEIHELNVVE